MSDEATETETGEDDPSVAAAMDAIRAASVVGADLIKLRMIKAAVKVCRTFSPYTATTDEIHSGDEFLAAAPKRARDAMLVEAFGFLARAFAEPPDSPPAFVLDVTKAGRG